MRLPYLLNDVSRQIRYAFDSRARSIGVTRPQYRVLMSIARNPGLTQSELADNLDVERITLGRMIDRMSAAGLVERRADPADRRVWRLHTLTGADALIERLASLGGEVTEEALSVLQPAERETLEALLEKLNNGIREGRSEKPKAAA